MSFIMLGIAILCGSPLLILMWLLSLGFDHWKKEKEYEEDIQECDRNIARIDAELRHYELLDHIDDSMDMLKDSICDSLDQGRDEICSSIIKANSALISQSGTKTNTRVRRKISRRIERKPDGSILGKEEYQEEYKQIRQGMMN